MRRSQAAHPMLPLDGKPIILAEQKCHHCAAAGVMVILLGRTANGAFEMTFCSVDCAKQHGWPWLPPSERRAPRPVPDSPLPSVVI